MLVWQRQHVDPVRAASDITSELSIHTDEVRARKQKEYLKSDLDHLGASVPEVRAVVRRFLRHHPGLGHGELVALARAMWADDIYEHRLAAVELLAARPQVLGPTDMATLESMLRQAHTWALVDPISISLVGPIVAGDQASAQGMDRWVADDDFWVRRSALLALLVPLREGRGDFERFGRYADALLDEREFFIAKAIGWVLRDTARRRPDMVFEWLEPRVARASGVTVREAVKYMSDAQRDEINSARTGG